VGLAPRFLDALRALRDALEEAGAPWMCIGGVAVIYKMVASRPRDLEDVERLLLLYGSALDIARIRETVGQFAAALEDRSRLENLERLLRQAGLPSR
jgi:hypothetical protein